MILLSILLHKSLIWGNSCSWVKARQAFNQLDCRILWSHISADGMTGLHWFFECRQIARRGKKYQPHFSMGVVLRGFSRVAVSLKIVYNEKLSAKKRLSMHFYFTIFHSNSTCLSCPIRFQCLLISWKFTRTTSCLSLHIGRYSDKENNKENKKADFVIGNSVSCTWTGWYVHWWL